MIPEITIFPVREIARLKRPIRRFRAIGFFTHVYPCIWNPRPPRHSSAEGVIPAVRDVIMFRDTSEIVLLLGFLRLLGYMCGFSGSSRSDPRPGSTVARFLHTWASDGP